MSRERELLKKALDFMLDAGANLNPLFKEINDNLLAQPEQTEQKPLSDETIADLWWNNYVGTADSVRNFARAIEHKHGIGGGE